MREERGGCLSGKGGKSERRLYNELQENIEASYRFRFVRSRWEFLRRDELKRAEEVKTSLKIAHGKLFIKY